MADHAERLKRISMRSWRRGTKEMDLILGPWSDAHLAALSPETLDHYEALLNENDQDLYAWISGGIAKPAQFQVLLETIAAFALTRLAPAAKA